MLQLIPIVAYLAIIGVILLIATRSQTPARLTWTALIVVFILFAAFSTVTLWQEGLIQFWINHTTNLAGNQVWLDLLIAVGIGFYLIAPRAKAVGMRLLPWAFAVIATATIALLPMLLRLLWLERRSRST